MPLKWVNYRAIRTGVKNGIYTAKLQTHILVGSAGAVDVSGMSFEGIEFGFAADRVLAPGQIAVLVANPEAFAEKYPGVFISGVYDGQLSNGGETIILKDVAGNTVLGLTYDDENIWPVSPDGRGDSLIFVDVNGDPGNPKSWRASPDVGGSPGE